MAIQVVIEDQTGNVRNPAKLSETATVDRLIRAIITTLKLPITDPAGRPITYYLAHNNRRLQDNDTLSTAEVQQGDTITIVPQMTAGTQFKRHGSTHGQSLIVLDGPPQQQLPQTGFPESRPVDARNSSIQVCFSPETLSRVWAQARAYPEQEVGGVLIGRVYEEDGQYLVDVENILEAQHTIAGLTFLTFTDETWLDLLHRRHTYTDSLVTGWYHSHPGFGIFLSMSDQFIHHNFFSGNPWYLALVVDPSSDDWGVFTWENGEIRRCYQDAKSSKRD